LGPGVLEGAVAAGAERAARDARVGRGGAVVEGHAVAAHVAAAEQAAEGVVHLEPAPPGVEVEAHVLVPYPAHGATRRRAAVRLAAREDDRRRLAGAHSEGRDVGVEGVTGSERPHLPAPAAALLTVDKVALRSVVDRVGPLRVDVDTPCRLRQRQRQGECQEGREHLARGYGRRARKANCPERTSLIWLRVRTSSRMARAASSITR